MRTFGKYRYNMFTPPMTGCQRDGAPDSNELTLLMLMLNFRPRGSV